MKLTFLGTGTSTGVPSIACDCETCISDDPRDKRLRVSVLIEHAGQTIIVDTSTDFRQQALRQGLKHLDAVLVTHCHADHIFGLDDIRPLNFRHGALGLYANERAWVDIRRIFKYVFGVCRSSHIASMTLRMRLTSAKFRRTRSPACAV